MDAIRTLWELSCTCGVVSLDDMKRWDAALRLVPEVIAKLHTLVNGPNVDAPRS